VKIAAAPLDRASYRPFGDVIAADRAVSGASANAGTARRFDRLGAIENLRPGATPNLCLFRVAPAAANPFPVRMLERHRHSTQVFIPMGGALRYLVVVCQGGDAPDLATLKAFMAGAEQGITYRPGIWHHPLIALDRTIDFACIVYEDGGAGDCEERAISSETVVILPG
jgi:ureidoglycolate lyase